MNRSIVFACCALLLTACITRRTEDVRPAVVETDASADGGDGGGNSGDANGSSTGNPPSCTRNSECVDPAASRCDLDTNMCAACKTTDDCPDKLVCVADRGCFECSAERTDACKGATPACHPESNTCVPCTASEPSACAATGTVCKTETSTCVACVDNSQCQSATASKCDADDCVGCTADADCEHLTATPFCDGAGECVACKVDTGSKSASASQCLGGKCVGCSDSAQHCSHVKDGDDDLPICLDQTCVQCTRDERDACGSDVCNALTHRCEDGVAVAGTDDCQPCVSNLQCKDDGVCLKMDFKGEEVGYFCQPKRATTCAAERPYFEEQKQALGIDGVVAVDVCTLRVSTCPALQDYSSLNCGVDEEGDDGLDDRGDDSLCGDERFADDGYCVEQSTGVYRCTMPCNNANEDCVQESGIVCSPQQHGDGSRSRNLCTL